jgi:hypothetical protein
MRTSINMGHVCDIIKIDSFFDPMVAKIGNTVMQFCFDKSIN